MDKIEKNSKDLEKSGGTISSGKYDATAGGKLDKDLDSKNKVLEVPENEHPQSIEIKKTAHPWF